MKYYRNIFLKKRNLWVCHSIWYHLRFVGWRASCPCIQQCQILLALGSSTALCWCWWRESVWIIWLHDMRGWVCSQNQGHLKLSLGFLVMYVDFVSGRRKTPICLLSYCFFAGCDEAGCAVQWCSSIGDSSLACFSSSHCLTITRLGCVAWCTEPGAALELLRSHRANCCGPGQLACFLQAFF